MHGMFYEDLLRLAIKRRVVAVHTRGRGEYYLLDPDTKLLYHDARTSEWPALVSKCKQLQFPGRVRIRCLSCNRSQFGNLAGIHCPLGMWFKFGRRDSTFLSCAQAECT